jgi:hypothetical protein
MAASHRVTTVPIATTYGYLLEPRREAQADGSVKVKYQLCLLWDTNIPEQKADLDKAIAEAYAEGVEVFGQNFWALVEQRSIRWPFRNGSEINPNTGQKRFGDGIIFANASSHTKPDVVSRYYDPADPAKKPRKITDPSEYYWGQKARVNLTFKHYKRTDGSGIAVYVNGAQLWHEGDKLGGAFDAQSEFDAEGEAPAAAYDGATAAPATSGPPATSPPATASLAKTPAGAPGAPAPGSSLL